MMWTAKVNCWLTIPLTVMVFVTNSPTSRILLTFSQNGRARILSGRAHQSQPSRQQGDREFSSKFDLTIDILVNNAGVYEFSPLEEITEKQFHKHFDVNVLGLLLASQEAVRHFDAAGGSIINISSVVTSLTPPTSSIYTGSKGAVDAITRTLAKELGPRKIRVNAINPGMVETEGFTAAGMGEGEFRKQVEAEAPLGRIGQPDDIAPVAVFLASSDSQYMTGEILRVSGGLR